MSQSKPATKSCPVCQYPVPSGGPRVRYKGREVQVCCVECAEKLRKESRPGKA
jgi:RNase P subunit RPR2